MTKWTPNLNTKTSFQLLIQEYAGSQKPTSKHASTGIKQVCTSVRASLQTGPQWPSYVALCCCNRILETRYDIKNIEAYFTYSSVMWHALL